MKLSPHDLSAHDTRRRVSWGITCRALAALPILVAVLWASGCTTVQPPAGPGQSSLPVLSGWFEGEEVFYITTDVSHADVAEAKGANFAPRLALALPEEGRAAPGRSSVDKVYAVTNFKQASVFASAPFPMGSASRDTAYSPLWQMIKVSWAAGATPQILRSEEDVLAAVERGFATLEATRVVLNCPIVHRGSKGALPGVSITVMDTTGDQAMPFSVEKAFSK
ncbi:MAG: hypothetical protein Q8K45_22125 [Rubrivivax sp.]|nr:hypothetical protein [Rubrivivax sp.]